MIFDQRFKVQFDESVGYYRENLPWILLGLAMAMGTAIVMIILIFLEDKCTNKRNGGSFTNPWVSFNKKTNVNAKRSYFRLFMIFLIIVVFLVGMTCAANIMGGSFWNIILGYGILAALIIQTCGEDMRNIWSYIKICWNARFSEGQWIKIAGAGLEGEIKAINILYTEIQRYSGTTPGIDSEEIVFANSLFFQYPVTRVFKRENEITPHHQ